MAWNWKLRHVGSADCNWLRDPDDRSIPEEGGPSSVRFNYGAFVERYLVRADAIEQQFVFHERSAVVFNAVAKQF